MAHRSGSLGYHLIFDYAFVLKEANGEVRVEHDRHIEGLCPREVWLEAFRSEGLSATRQMDVFGRDVFVARPART